MQINIDTDKIKSKLTPKNIGVAVVALALVITLVVCLTQCGGGTISGTYQTNNTRYSFAGDTWTSYTWGSHSASWLYASEGTYEIKDDKIYFYGKDGELKKTNDFAVIDSNNIKIGLYTFTKVK